jgi:hypothetical protein
MDRDPQPSSVARLATMVREIEQRGEVGHRVLLADLLCAAWPTGQAQRQ